VEYDAQPNSLWLGNCMHLPKIPIRPGAEPFLYAVPITDYPCPSVFLRLMPVSTLNPKTK